MPILVGIDGTGSAFTPGNKRDEAYDRDFTNSFVRRLSNTGHPNSKYFRGPVALGGGLVEAINGAYTFIQDRRKAGVKEKILVTGYSRGAAGAVSLAAKLQRAKIAVDAMLLFDCVDRHLFIDAEVIPNNVANVMHVIRNPASGSRKSFGNDGMKYRPPTHYEGDKVWMFMCTHGGMGGTPWDVKGHSMSDFIEEGFPDGKTKITYEQDRRVSQQVWAFVQPFIIKHEFRAGGGPSAT